MLSFFILTAATATTGTFPPAEKYDFLGIRVWQTQDQIFPTKSSPESATKTQDEKVQELVRKHLITLKTIGEKIQKIKEEQNKASENLKTAKKTKNSAQIKSTEKIKEEADKKGVFFSHDNEPGNMAIIIIDNDNETPIIVPYIFLSKASFESNDLKRKSLIATNTDLNEFQNKCLAVYEKTKDLEKYKNYLKNLLNSGDENLLTSFRKIFLNEQIKGGPGDFFYLNWCHSEQGFLQWLERNANANANANADADTSTAKDPEFIKLKNHTNGKACKIYILTYRDMCLRCSTTLFLQNERLKTLLGAQSVKIISISVVHHTDNLSTSQALVFNEQTRSFPSTSNTLIRGKMNGKEAATDD